MPASICSLRHRSAGGQRDAPRVDADSSVEAAVSLVSRITYPVPKRRYQAFIVNDEKPAVSLMQICSINQAIFSRSCGG